MTYNAAGFPFGGMLGKVSETSSKGNPSVTITGGRIAALRRDDHGQLVLLQVDGSLQPGNSGGPIVDEKTGKLLGVVVAKLGAVDTIGLVVPAEEVRRALAGRVGALDLTLQSHRSRTRRSRDQGPGRRPQGNGPGCGGPRRPGLRRARSAPTATAPGRRSRIPRRSSSRRTPRRRWPRAESRSP